MHQLHLFYINFTGNGKENYLFLFCKSEIKRENVIYILRSSSAKQVPGGSGPELITSGKAVGVQLTLSFKWPSEESALSQPNRVRLKKKILLFLQILERDILQRIKKEGGKKTCSTQLIDQWDSINDLFSSHCSIHNTVPWTPLMSASRIFRPTNFSYHFHWCNIELGACVPYMK